MTDAVCHTVLYTIARPRRPLLNDLAGHVRKLSATGVRNMALELFVKAGKDGNSLGDCPFSHRANMTLRVKGLDFKITTVNTYDKPKWFLDMYAKGTVPVLKKGGEVIGDSAIIAERLEKDHPEPSMKASDEACKIDANLYPKFIPFVKNKDASQDETLKKPLVEELKKINDILAKSPGKFVEGDTLKHPDCSMLPKLYHIKVAGKHYKNFEMPADCGALTKYMETAFDTDVFKASQYPEEEVIYGWSMHMK
ncbi:uncharacterized protein [Ptychodera flava]|uniref:uncharacterized protein n=1 Tax=Ptychodera flava TaxID=63121 RepID=UPI003969CD2F